MVDFEQQFKQEVELIERELEKIMDVVERNAIAPRLTEAMQYTLFAGGKRIRPFLTVQVAGLIGGKKARARQVGAAVELIHTYSLIHDDLPSMDNDDYRRGELTNHKVFGEAMAILAGDALLTLAFQLLSSIDLPADNLVRIMGIISRGSGYTGMVGGQALDLAAGGKEINLSDLKIIHRAKTGQLIYSSILAGAYCGDPDQKQLKALDEFAANLGLCFQIVDDILDVVGDQEEMGKKPGSDQKQAKQTYPDLLGLDKSRLEAKKAATRAKKALDPFGSIAEILKELVNYVVDRKR